MDMTKPLTDSQIANFCFYAVFLAAFLPCTYAVFKAADRLLSGRRPEPPKPARLGAFRVTVEHPNNFVLASYFLSDEAAGRLLVDLERQKRNAMPGASGGAESLPSRDFDSGELPCFRS
jgi:hypothetical protein